MEKECTRCKEVKDISLFGNLKNGKDGKCSYCKECAKNSLRKWLAENKEHTKKRRNDYTSKQRNSNSEQYIKAILRNQVRRYILDKKGKSTESILGETFDNVRQHIENKFVEGMSWNNYGEWHIDHIKPLSSGKSKEDYIRLNHYTNLQPLWAEDNMRKRAKEIG